MSRLQLVTHVLPGFLTPVMKQLLTLYQTTKFWTVTKLKAFADDKLNVAKMASSLFDRAENTLGKGENAGYQHFLLFPLCFPKLSTSGSLKVGIVWSRVKQSPYS